MKPSPEEVRAALVTLDAGLLDLLQLADEVESMQGTLRAVDEGHETMSSIRRKGLEASLAMCKEGLAEGQTRVREVYCSRVNELAKARDCVHLGFGWEAATAPDVQRVSNMQVHESDRSSMVKAPVREEPKIRVDTARAAVAEEETQGDHLMKAKYSRASPNGPTKPQIRDEHNCEPQVTREHGLSIDTAKETKDELTKESDSEANTQHFQYSPHLLTAPQGALLGSFQTQGTTPRDGKGERSVTPSRNRSVTPSRNRSVTPSRERSVTPRRRRAPKIDDDPDGMRTLGMLMDLGK